MRCLSATSELLAHPEPAGVLDHCFHVPTTGLLVLGQLGGTAKMDGKMQGTLAWAAPELLAGAAADTKVHVHLPCLTGCGNFGHARCRRYLSRKLDATDCLDC